MKGGEGNNVGWWIRSSLHSHQGLWLSQPEYHSPTWRKTLWACIRGERRWILIPPLTRRVSRIVCDRNLWAWNYFISFAYIFPDVSDVITSIVLRETLIHCERWFIYEKFKRTRGRMESNLCTDYFFFIILRRIELWNNFVRLLNLTKIIYQYRGKEKMYV